MTVSSRRCGAIPTDTGIRWRVWAPFAKRTQLVLVAHDDHPREYDMLPEPDGFFQKELPAIPDGQRYYFRLNDGELRADPCSLFQPDNIPGPSAVVRTDRFPWTDHAWHGVPQSDLALYELHVGTFTPEGAFDAIIPRLPALRDLGITAIEIMPVGQFPGGRNWGYDGVLPYATQNTYGGPAGLARLVDAAHAAGLAVLLDVVYNHFGPEHNYLSEFGPYLHDCYRTPWGQAVNYDGRDSDPVRDYVLDNARMWLSEFHLDGLRLDAVHAIYDLGAHHILRALQEVADDVAAATGRQIHLIAESDLNDPRIVQSPDRGGHGLAAQWADDFHHALHALLAGERRGYYSDYGEPRQLARALETPFLYEWTYSRNRRRKHGAPAAGLPPERFVACIQNHDQVGNRALGERLTELLSDWRKSRLAAALLLLSPYIPLLFMGEEYGEPRRFPFFCSFCGPELIQAVREGRKREFSDFVDSPDDIPDPAAEETFKSAILTWQWPENSPAAGLRRLYADLLRGRREWPWLRAAAGQSGQASITTSDPSSCLLNYQRGPLTIFANIASHNTPLRGSAGRLLWSSESPRYGGDRADSSLAPQDHPSVQLLLPYEVVAFG
jgi:maltooligosyltrehalose trehalohydrolase